MSRTGDVSSRRPKTTATPGPSPTFGVCPRGRVHDNLRAGDHRNGSWDSRQCSEATMHDLQAIYDDYHAKVVAYAAMLLGRDEADDIAQAVFIKVGRSLGTLSDRSKLGAWIHAITLNTVRDVARKRSSSPDHLAAPLVAGPDEHEGPGRPVCDVPDPCSRTPEELLERRQMVACYLEYVEQLPPSYSEVYVLSEFEGLSNEDISRRLSISLATAKIRLHRARTRLLDALRRDCQCYRNHRGELMGERKRP